MYTGNLKLNGKENEGTLLAANNYAKSLKDLERFEEAKSLIRKTTPVARRVLGVSHIITLRLRWMYALTLYADPCATLDDLREAVTIYEDAGRIARRVLGGAHPVTTGIEEDLQRSRCEFRARETPSSGGAEVLQTADDLAAYFG